MNFFADQAKAKSNTSKLVLLLSLAVVSLIAITQVLVITVFCWSQGIAVFDVGSFRHAVDLLGGELFWSIAFFIAAIIAMAALFKSAQLAGGGHAVAEAMDGVLIKANSTDLDEKKILNVVAEMAIASGTSVPPVYVIEDDAINAFAAGHTAKDAVIGITRGCIKTLSRDELQGVIAHEFSHIFNGDMRLNIRLISILHGILFIGMIGHFILRMQPRRSSRRDSKGTAVIALLGLGLYIIGYTGTFFGNLIKAAVSRQREFLADASAVQFTRNPSGIADALKKIGGYSHGSALSNPAADQISHLLFNQGVSSGFSALMATHPPLAERIKRIEPRWNGTFIKTALAYSNPFTPKEPKKPAGAEPAIAISLLASVGQPTAAHIEEAKTILTSIPQPLIEAAHDVYSARAVVYCLLLDPHREPIFEQQLVALKNNANTETWKNVMALREWVATLPLRFRLPLIDICIPTLKQLSPSQYQAFKKKMLLLIQADKKVDLFEWSLYRIVVHHLEHTALHKSNKTNPLTVLADDCQRLISAVALKNNKTLSGANACFARGWQTLKLADAGLLDNALEDINALNSALKNASTLTPLKKPLLIKACCAALEDMNQPESVELIRAIADGLDVPMPPLLTGQSLC